jgi:high-affinity K+ transport system ATPase subunit B
VAGDAIQVTEEATVTEDGTVIETVAELPECNATGPYKGVRCTEPEGHAGDHQNHVDGGRAAWAGGTE